MTIVNNTISYTCNFLKVNLKFFSLHKQNSVNYPNDDVVIMSQYNNMYAYIYQIIIL